MSLNPTGIPWATHSWNPLYGCLHEKADCECSEYCYANTISSRRLNLDFRRPMFYPKRLKDVTAKQKSRVIFVGSMTDMMGAWWTEQTIQEVINCCEACPQHIFMWLTKNPARYRDFVLPMNCWLGASITGPKDDWREDELYRLFGNPKFTCGNPLFISYEPIVGKWIPKHTQDWIIAGCMTDSQGNADPHFPVDIEAIRRLADYAPLLIKPPLSTDPADREYPKDIGAIIDTWSK